MNGSTEQDAAGDNYSGETPSAALASILRDVLRMAAELGEMQPAEIQKVIEELLDELADLERAKLRLVDS